MQFEENTTLRETGEKVGFFVSFFLFSSTFYLVLKLLHKLPVYVGYTYVVIIIVVVYIIGLIFVILFEK